MGVFVQRSDKLDYTTGYPNSAATQGQWRIGEIITTLVNHQRTTCQNGQGKLILKFIKCT